ncbi:MAG: ribonuclease H-like YkuK family protein [Patescibacteria group bacterium]
MNTVFNTSYGLKIDADQVVREILDFIKIKPNAHYKVIIGSDSLRLQDNDADFVTAIVVHRVGNGGRYFWRRLDMGKFYNLHDRIIQEVMLSIDTAKAILTDLEKVTKEQAAQGVKLNWDFEIHVDVGENGPTKNLIQEVVGMVRANNFEAKTKPDSYAASKVADRHV